MALVIKELLPSDTINEIIEKVNFSFDQVKLNGGGEMGLPGKDSTTRGIPGIRGTNWYVYNGDPNTIVFESLIEKDLYLNSSNGDVWICVDPNATIKWEQVYIDYNIPLNLTGPQGPMPDIESVNPSIFTKKDFYLNSTEYHHFYYVNKEEFETNVNFRPLLFGGYVNNDSETYNISDTELLNGLKGENGVLFLYNPTGASGGKQLKFFGENTKHIENAPEIYSDSSDIFTIKNTRIVSDFDINVLEGVNIEAVDTNVDISTPRNIYLTVDGSPITMATGDTSIKNIVLSAQETYINDTSYPDSNIVSLENIYEDATYRQYGYVNITSDTKGDVKEISLISRSVTIATSAIKETSLSLSNNYGIDITLANSNYIRINSGQQIDAISTNTSLVRGASASNYTIPTQLAVKTYVDTKAASITAALNTHITTTGAMGTVGSTHPHPTYLNQQVRTDSQPLFIKLFIDNTNTFIDTSVGGSLVLKSANNGLVIAGTSVSSFDINGDTSPVGSIPNKFIFRRGTPSSFADVEASAFIAHDYIETNGNWIRNTASGNAIQIDSAGNVGIKAAATTSYALRVTGDAQVTNTLIVNRLYLDNTSNGLDTTSGYLNIFTAVDELLFTQGTPGAMYINHRAGIGYSPTSYIWETGSAGSYAAFNIGQLNMYGNILTQGNWINYGGGAAGIYMQPSNRVGINTTGDGTHTLDINGTTIVRSTLDVNGQINAYGHIATHGTWISYSGGGAGIYIQASNYIGINTTGDGVHALDVNGAVYSRANLDVAGTTYIQGLYTYGGANFYSPVTIGTPAVYTTANIYGTTTITGTEYVNGVLSISGTLTLGSSVSSISTDSTLSSNSNAILPTQRAVKTYVDNVANSERVPIGGIIMFYWTTYRPSNYQLCDGSYISAGPFAGNYTPNLTNKFIRAGTSVGATGGADAISLTSTHLPAHVHSIPYESSHFHYFRDAKDGGSPNWRDYTKGTSFDHQTSYAGGHSHSGATYSAGSGGAFSILPSYYVLAYYMRIY